MDGAPDIPCSRRVFTTTSYHVEADPAADLTCDWMFDWPEEDRAVFWSGLADLYGRHALRVLTVETPADKPSFARRFQSLSAGRDRGGVWLSRHQPIDGLQEVLQ